MLRGHKILDRNADGFVKGNLLIGLAPGPGAARDLGNLDNVITPDNSLRNGNDEIAGRIEAISPAIDDVARRASYGFTIHLPRAGHVGADGGDESPRSQ